METIVLGTALAGAAVLMVVLYITSIILLITKMYNHHLESDSMGIKNLKYQESNTAWNEFVTHR
jgi:hypothetical protein